MAELDGGKVGKVTFPDPKDLTQMTLRVSPDQGLWRGATFEFSIRVPDMYPHEPPKVLCHTKVREKREPTGGREAVSHKPLPLDPPTPTVASPPLSHQTLNRFPAPQQTPPFLTAGLPPQH